MSFKCIRRLQGFYLINDQHYDSFLFVYYVNGGCSPCSPLELLVAAVSYMTSSLKTVAARLRKNEEESPKLPKSSSLPSRPLVLSLCLLSSSSSMRVITLP
ncbi:hypothetical protein NC652_041056 [Populus alba x Populus x berolinensis]|nr:hypothetical protein NC652_041056 [Populus alba x Populus x berolinensis]